MTVPQRTLGVRAGPSQTNVPSGHDPRLYLLRYGSSRLGAKPEPDPRFRLRRTVGLGSLSYGAGRDFAVVSNREVLIMTTSDPVQEPRALVVFESMFGNTEQVARAVAEGLGQAGVTDQRLRGVGGARRPPAVRRAPRRRCALPMPSRSAGPRPGSEAVRQGAEATPRRRSGCASGSRRCVRRTGPADARRSVRHPRQQGPAAASRRGTERRPAGQAARVRERSTGRSPSSSTMCKARSSTVRSTAPRRGAARWLRMMATSAL